MAWIGYSFFLSFFWSVLVLLAKFESFVFLFFFWKSFSFSFILETILILAAFFRVAFFHFCDKMTPNLKSKRIPHGPESFLFLKLHEPNIFLSCFTSGGTISCTFFFFKSSGTLNSLRWPVYFLKLWRDFVLFCGTLQQLRKMRGFSKTVNATFCSSYQKVFV